jgi:hypothetical protein
MKAGCIDGPVDKLATRNQPRGPSYKAMPEELGVLEVSIHPRWSFCFL